MHLNRRILPIFTVNYLKKFMNVIWDGIDLASYRLDTPPIQHRLNCARIGYAKTISQRLDCARNGYTRTIQHRLDCARISYAKTIRHRLDCARIDHAKTIQHQLDCALLQLCTSDDPFYYDKEAYLKPIETLMITNKHLICVRYIGSITLIRAVFFQNLNVANRTN